MYGYIVRLVRNLSAIKKSVLLDALFFHFDPKLESEESYPLLKRNS
jgi:hypothetical protein